jgi:hypothetical protein
MAYQDPTLGSGAGDSTTGSTTDVAKEQAGRVGQTATQAGGQVAQTTKEQARNVVGEAKQQARDLVGEARSQVRDQAGTQKGRAVQGLHALGDELDQMAEQGGQSGLATEVARQVSGRTRDLARYLERHEPADLLAEVRAYARRRPVVFLAGATLAGVVAGRLTKGITAGPPEDDGARSLTSGYDYPDTGYRTPGYGTPGYQTPGYETPGYQTPGYQEPGYQSPGYGTAGYPPAGQESPGYGTAEGGFRVPDATPAGGEYAPMPGGYSEGGQGVEAYPPVEEPRPGYDPAIDPDQPPARGWTP